MDDTEQHNYHFFLLMATVCNNKGPPRFVALVQPPQKRRFVLSFCGLHCRGCNRISRCSFRSFVGSHNLKGKSVGKIGAKERGSVVDKGKQFQSNKIETTQPLQPCTWHGHCRSFAPAEKPKQSRKQREYSLVQNSANHKSHKWVVLFILHRQPRCVLCCSLLSRLWRALSCGGQAKHNKIMSGEEQWWWWWSENGQN